MLSWIIRGSAGNNRLPASGFGKSTAQQDFNKPGTGSGRNFAPEALPPRRRRVLRSRSLMHVSVAAGLLAGAGRTMQIRNKFFQISDEQGKALRFRPQREQLLFEIEIEG
jgi:hypothetical protein